MDLPGFGASELPEGDISIEYYASWVFRLCDALGIESAAVVGNSMGGFIAAEMAIRIPRACSVSRSSRPRCSGRTTAAPQPLVGLARLSDDYVARTLERSTDAVATRPRLRAWALATAGFRYPSLISEELAHELVRSARRTDGYLPALEAMADYPLDEELPKIGCPTLIVWGAHDTLVPVKDAKRMEDLIPGSRRVVFERTGHVAMLERPERFNRLLRDFLRRGGGTSTPGGEETGSGRRRRRSPSARYRVTAPSEALETSLAYLPKTPLVTVAGGARRRRRGRRSRRRGGRRRGGARRRRS